MFKADRHVLAFLLIAALGVCGCGKSSPPSAPKPGPQKPKAAVASDADKKDEIKVEKEAYVYESKGRRDPFLPVIVVQKEKPHRKKKANPIENADLDELKLIAILSDASHQYYAMISLPDGKAYTVRKGTIIGLNEGRIESITKDSVLIREQVKDYKGQPKIKDTILKLRKEGEE